MPQPAQLSPWIESLILSYDLQVEGSGSSSGVGVGGGSRLKAHVIGVGDMSLSQAQTSEGPVGLLFLSDGVLQIPAVLTASAWEHMQEQEDREDLSSLLNTTVCIQDYRLQFHMGPEQTKCRFFLSIGELAMTAAGTAKDKTPCCTTLPSIRTKIRRTWRTLLGQEDSQRSQCGFDLTELLGEWQLDCLQDVLEDIREQLMMASSRPASPQPSTSTYSAPLTRPTTTTSWDVDRVAYKGEKQFSIPIKFLLIPEDNAQRLQTDPGGGGSPRVRKPPEVTQPSVEEAEWQIPEPTPTERVCDPAESSPLPVEDDTMHEDIITAMVDSPLSNPWDIFPPPCVPSESSPDVTPTSDPPAAEPKPDPAATLTSTQFHGSKESSYLPPYQKPQSHQTTASSSVCVTSESPPDVTPTTDPTTAKPKSIPAAVLTSTQLHGSKESSYLPPYQKPQSRQTTASSLASASATPPGSDERRHRPLTTQQHLQDDEEDRRRRKRKHREDSPEALTTLEEEEEVSGSPPSWLFSTQAGGSGVESSSSPKPTTPRMTPSIHSDSTPFSYSYRVTGQNLQDCSRFRVSESLLQWAVKYLLAPKKTDNPPNVV